MIIELLQVSYTKAKSSYHWLNIHSVLLEYYVWSQLRKANTNTIKSQYTILLKYIEVPNDKKLTLSDYNIILVAFEAFIRTKKLSPQLRASYLASFIYIFDIKRDLR